MDSERIALVVGAHPDDCEFGAGGTTWAWARQGWQMHFLVATDGSRGSSNPGVDRVELAAQRKKEQVEAAQHLMVRSCRFLGREDGKLLNDDALVMDIVKAIRELRPQVVFTHSPEPLDYRPFDRAEGVWVNHKDHRALSVATLDAVYPCARDPHYYPELGLPVHKVPKVLLWGCKEPDFRVKSTPGLRRKLEALAFHQSQFTTLDWEALKETWSPVERFLTVELPN